MKTKFTNYTHFIFTLLFFASLTSGLAQNNKPIKNLKIFTQTQSKSYNNSEQLLQSELKLPDGNYFSIVSETVDNIGANQVKFQQYYNTVKVEFGTTTLQTKNGNYISLSNNVFQVANISTSPKLSSNQAFNKAIKVVGAKTYLWENKAEAALVDSYKKPEGELVIFPKLKGISFTNRLAYKFDIYATDPVYRADVYIDAQTGEFIMENAKIHHADTPGTGASFYNGTVSFTCDNNNGTYRLRQTANGDGVQTFDMNSGTNYANAAEITSNSSVFSGNETGVSAHYGAESTHKYFMEKHSRNSYNGQGAVILSYVSYDNNYFNAFWDGSRMTYGDGNGRPLVTLDIVGHELAHGVTQFSANLVYAMESGALNESFSDIFGETVENFGAGSNDWLMGDQLGASGSGGAFRSMSDPNSKGDPDTYFGTNWAPLSGGDNGGVHTNSGVQNFWFYLLTQGGTGSNDNGAAYTVTGVGMEKAAKIAYRNLTTYLNANSKFADARTGAIQAAKDLYGAGSAEEIATTNAWHAVGVGDPFDGGGGGDTTAPSVPANLAASNVANTTVDLSWTASTDNVAVTGYDVYQGETSIASVTGTSHQVTGLTASTAYTFKVRAKDAAGNLSGFSNVMNVTTTDNNPSDCLSGDISLSITLDNYPEETAWTLKDAAGTTLQSATYSTSNPDGSTVTATFSNLANGAYTYTITDAYGDGLCCNYGQGSYTLSSAAGVIHTGASFTSSEATAFCIEGANGGGDPPSGYCASNGNNTSDEYIANVTMGSINNTSTASAGGYGDYTSISTNLSANNSITITPGWTNTIYDEGYAVWVDFNRDGDFEDANELVFSKAPSKDTSVSGSFAVPAGASPGATRMRVSLKYNGIPTTCESFAWGEVEDYVVVIGNNGGIIYGFGGSLGATVSSEFIIYPNPVKGNSLNIATQETATEIVIYNLLGQTVYNKPFTSSVDVSALKNGMYIIQVQAGEKTFIERFIKE